MNAKPAHLGPQYGAQFGDASVVDAYRRRVPYADAAVDAVLDLLPAGGRRVLDIGCGRGDLAIPMARRGVSVDAVDPSEQMLASGRRRAGGDSPGLRWIHGAIETAPLERGYQLATAAESIHWTDWPVAFPRLAALLTPGAVLAIVERGIAPASWHAELVTLIESLSTNRDYAPYDVVAELSSRGLFEERGRTRTATRVFEQSAADYVESFHSRNGLSRERMTAEAAREFDTRLTELVRAHVGDGAVRLSTNVRIVWGRPRVPDVTAVQ